MCNTTALQRKIQKRTNNGDLIVNFLADTVEGKYHDVEARHTIVVPPNVPHGFTANGGGPAKIIGMFPAKDPFLRTRYLEGRPPEAHG